MHCQRYRRLRIRIPGPAFRRNPFRGRRVLFGGCFESRIIQRRFDNPGRLSLTHCLPGRRLGDHRFGLVGEIRRVRARLLGAPVGSWQLGLERLLFPSLSGFLFPIVGSRFCFRCGLLHASLKVHHVLGAEGPNFRNTGGRPGFRGRPLFPVRTGRTDLGRGTPGRGRFRRPRFFVSRFVGGLGGRLAGFRGSLLQKRWCPWPVNPRFRGFCRGRRLHAACCGVLFRHCRLPTPGPRQSTGLPEFGFVSRRATVCLASKAAERG